MAGNGWEWVNDRLHESSPFHKGKGGGFFFHHAAELQVYFISTFTMAEDKPSIEDSHITDGFRVLCK